MNIRKLTVKVLGLQCAVAKTSILGVLMAIVGLPVMIVIGGGELFGKILSKITPKRIKNALTSPIPFLSIIDEADEQCGMNMKKVERFFFGKN